MAPMMVGIDRVGRVVIPRDVRDRLNLVADTELELTLEGDSIRLTPTRARSRVIAEVDGWPVLERVEGITTTDADVQRWRDADQR
jgi:AbrB family looped-hinge helix DNA binding protein